MTLAVVPIDTNKPAPGTMLDFALRYADIGWRIFPAWWIEQGKCACGVECKSPGKHPIGTLAPKGQDNATTDLGTIRRWWKLHPKAHIAVDLGSSALCAIDIDPRNGGIYTIEDVEAKHGALQSDLLQFTGGGGEHRVFRAPSTGNLPGKLGKGVDVKQNGYIIVEPSGHLSGKRYAWEASSSPLEGAVASPLPDWLRDLVHPKLAPAHDLSAPLHDAELATELADALPHIPSNDRQVWLDIGMALHNELGGQYGFDMWCAWSQSSSKFDPVDQIRVWRSFKRVGMAGISRGTVFRLAQEHGWINRGSALAPIPVAIPMEQLACAVAPAAAAGLPSDLLTVPGVLGDVVAWINASSRKPQPLFAVQAALALGSVIAGRRYRTDNGNWPALYFLNVGPSGCGKEHAKYAVEQLLEEAHLGKLIGVSRFASESGLISSLIERPIQFSVLDEFGKFLQACAVTNNFADRNTIKALLEVWGRTDGVLRPTGYSTAGLSSKQAEELAKRLVRKPSLTLLALSTPQTLFAGLTSEAIGDGFLNRFLTVHADAGRQLARQVAPISPPPSVISWMQRLRSRTTLGNMAAFDAPHDQDPTPLLVRIDAAAQALFIDFEQRMHARMAELDHEGLSEMLMRGTEMAMRLALVVALSSEAGSITTAHAEWACAYVETHAERNLLQLRAHIADGPFNALCKAIRQIAANAGETGVTERDLDRSSRHWRSSPARLRQEALAVLQREERIALVSGKKSTQRGGRTRNAWVALADE